MNIRDDIAEALEDLESLSAPSATVATHQVTWRGRTFPCTISTERRGEILIVGGFERRLDLTLKIRKSLLDPIRSADTTDLTADSTLVTLDADQIDPRPNKEITLASRSRKYRIAETRLDATEAYYALDLVDAYKP